MVGTGNDEGSLPFVTLLDPYVVVTGTKIHLGEVLRSLHLLHEIGDQGKRVTILDRVRVQRAVILAGSIGTILLPNEEERTGNGRFRWTDIAFGLVFLNELLQLRPLSRCDRVNLGFH